MKIASFNKSKWAFDKISSDWRGNKEKYKSLADIYDGNPDTIYIIHSLFIISKKDHPEMINDENPIVTIDDCFVNVPQNQLPEFKGILADPDVVRAADNDEIGFKIRPYFHETYKKECYSIVWLDLNDGFEVN